MSDQVSHPLNDGVLFRASKIEDAIWRPDRETPASLRERDGGVRIDTVDDALSDSNRTCRFAIGSLLEICEHAILEGAIAMLPVGVDATALPEVTFEARRRVNLR